MLVDKLRSSHPCIPNYEILVIRSGSKYFGVVVMVEELYFQGAYLLVMKLKLSCFPASSGIIGEDIGVFAARDETIWIFEPGQ